MTKEEFIARHVNELTGFLLEAFIVRVAEDESKVKSPGFSAVRKGEFMIEQMKRARVILGQLFDDLPGPCPPLSNEDKKKMEEVEARFAKIKEELDKPRNLAQVKEDAKSLNEADRAKFREWIEQQPKKTEAKK